MAEVMGPMKAMRRLFGRYVDFDGRSGQAAYAWAMLGFTLITGGFTYWLWTRGNAITASSIFASDVIFVVMFLTYAILAVPYASLHIRRYRDAGLSPWLLILTVMVPLIALLLDHGIAWLNYASLGLLALNVLLGLLPSKKVLAF